METRVYREQEWTTLGETARDWGDYRDHVDKGIEGRLGETARDWGDYRDYGDQSI